MRLPRDLSGSDLAQALHKLGYSITRQTGSHLRLTTHEHGEHHLTIPQHTHSVLEPCRPSLLTLRHTSRSVATPCLNGSSVKVARTRSQRVAGAPLPMCCYRIAPTSHAHWSKRASRMLKKSASVVLTSFRPSTYPRGYASALHLLRPCWTAFLSILPTIQALSPYVLSQQRDRQKPSFSANC